MFCHQSASKQTFKFMWRRNLRVGNTSADWSCFLQALWSARNDGVFRCNLFMHETSENRGHAGLSALVTRQHGWKLCCTRFPSPVAIKSFSTARDEQCWRTVGGHRIVSKECFSWGERRCSTGRRSMAFVSIQAEWDQISVIQIGLWSVWHL